MKYLHTMIRVTDLERSIKFYTEGLGFKVEKRSDHARDKFTLVFLRASGDDSNGPMIELTHNWEKGKYVLGDGYGHTAYRVKSISKVQTQLKSAGYDLSWGPGKTPDGKRAMAFVDDPDGYEIELLEG